MYIRPNVHGTWVLVMTSSGKEKVKKNTTEIPNVFTTYSLESFSKPGSLLLPSRKLVLVYIMKVYEKL